MFASLHRRKLPIGDPTIPPDVEKAKLIRYSMTERADIGEGEDSKDVLCAFEYEDEGRETTHFDEELTGMDGIKSSDGIRENTLINLRSPATARPLVRKRGSKETPGSSTAELIELYKLQMMQDQARRDEEKEARALEREEGKKWRQQLREDRLRREAERDEDRKERALERAHERESRAEEGK
ncbi:hypothetical protein BWQ96_09315 [Gracilariopsis chorda]|uniref:Uncharacterized protein n=1 Tax=Gracilariopsis chorda TaxID=448386 RepID=A0A2V3IIL1_9FLOR|nr:hypothetical protein BWQ96_09315 [Gracilariopsis chorda]|eukprot:PXF40960.1 hypothetical protein BWQ96_09315 [Gracilariopsis chorda]